VGPYFRDFFCAEANLAVELDGGGHNTPAQEDHDNKRSEFLQSRGVRVLRFWNSQVKENLEGVLEHIRIEVSTPSPQSSPRKGEEEG